MKKTFEQGHKKTSVCNTEHKGIRKEIRSIRRQVIKLHERIDNVEDIVTSIYELEKLGENGGENKPKMEVIN